MCFRTGLLILVLVLGCKEKESVEPISQKPNIIIIMTDDQGWGDLSLHGNTNLQTPNLDKLASNGVRFTNFFVQPVCSPTRAEMLTGRYARRLGVYSTSAGGERLNLDEQTLADIFRESGYSTAAYGKWHNGSQPPYHPYSRGFDDYYGFTSGHWGNYFSPMLDHNGRIVKGKGFLPDDLTARALDFIEHHADKPFFLLLSLNTPHSPMQVPDAYWDRFRDKKLDLRHRDSTLEDPRFTRAALAMVENIDDNVGRVDSILQAHSLKEHTVVVFLSDNGPNSYRWNGGMRGRKGSTDEGGVKVPFFMQWEGTIPKGKKIPQIAAAIDLLPTLTSLAGISYHSAKSLDGRDLSPLLKGSAEDPEDRLLFQYWNGATSVRTAQYRLDQNNRLYDMVKDPGQTYEINKEVPEILDSLIRAKQKWLASTIGITEKNDDRPLTFGTPGSDFIYLPARDGIPHGEIERSNKYPNSSYFTNWTRESDYISWDIEVLTKGSYKVVLYYTCAARNSGAEVALQWDKNSLTTKISQAHDPPLQGMEHDRYPRVESYVKDFKPLSMGVLEMNRGRGPLKLNALKKNGEGLIDVQLLTFERVY